MSNDRRGLSVKATNCEEHDKGRERGKDSSARESTSENSKSGLTG
jgi:hypothetical protein